MHEMLSLLTNSQPKPNQTKDKVDKNELNKALLISFIKTLE